MKPRRQPAPARAGRTASPGPAARRPASSGEPPQPLDCAPQARARKVAELAAADDQAEAQSLELAQLGPDLAGRPEYQVLQLGVDVGIEALAVGGRGLTGGLRGRPAAVLTAHVAKLG